MSSGGHVTEFFPVLTEYEELLDMCERRASSGKDCDFVADMRARYEQYGDQSFLSLKQKQWLERIAGVTE